MGENDQNEQENYKNTQHHTKNNQNSKPNKIRKHIPQQNENSDDEKEGMNKILNLAGSKHKYIKVQYEDNKAVSIRFGKNDSMQDKMDKIKKRIAKNSI